MTIEQDKKEGEGDETRKSVLGDKFGAAIKALIMKKVQENNDLRKVEKAENPRKIEHQPSVMLQMLKDALLKKVMTLEK